MVGTLGAMASTEPTLFDQVVNLCKRRSFVFPSAEIYGGFRSTYDYGPLGVLMLRNVKDAWWRSMVQLRSDVVGLDAAILSPPKVWEASGHLDNFSDARDAMFITLIINGHYDPESSNHIIYYFITSQ